jgi:hypothetical protein
VIWRGRQRRWRGKKLRKLMTLTVVLAVVLVAALPTNGLPVPVRITELRRRVSILEHRLRYQTDTLKQVLDSSERVEGELKARIQQLEEELNSRSR